MPAVPPVPPAPPAAEDVEIVLTGRLPAADVAAVTALVDAATEADGVVPLSEHVLLHLRHGGDHPVRNLLARDAAGRLLAYAHLDVTDQVEGPSAEVVVHPAYRRRGLGRRVVTELVRASPDGRLRLWAHGRMPGAAALAASLGFEQSRELLQLRRPLGAPMPPVSLPDGVTVRRFRPGVDDEAWVRLNARAFADHPEQGTWTVDDLRRRLAEPWFDPAGFFLAERDRALVGFHWTKIHGGENGGDAVAGGPHGHDPIGEVYVVGVDPDARGSGLGRALILVGLHHLRQRGLPTAMLYVDADNAAALRAYTALGFREWDVDVMYRNRPRR